MTTDKRAEFVDALNYLKLCSTVVGVAEGRRGKASHVQQRDEDEATELVLALYDEAGREAVIEECARVVEAEVVDAEATGSREDHAYNFALEHAASAIRALNQPSSAAERRE